MFIPTTAEEVRSLGWERLDVILVSGDTYIDTPCDGAAIIGRVLMDAGYRVTSAMMARTRSATELDMEHLGKHRRGTPARGGHGPNVSRPTTYRSARPELDRRISQGVTRRPGATPAATARPA